MVKLIVAGLPSHGSVWGELSKGYRPAYHASHNTPKDIEEALD